MANYSFEYDLELFAAGMYFAASPIDLDSIVKYKILGNSICYLNNCVEV